MRAINLLTIDMILIHFHFPQFSTPTHDDFQRSPRQNRHGQVSYFSVIKFSCLFGSECKMFVSLNGGRCRFRDSLGFLVNFVNDH